MLNAVTISSRLLRAYALMAAVLIVAILPMAIVRIGTIRRSSVSVDWVPRLSGPLAATMNGRPLRIVEVSIAGGPHVAAPSLRFLRQVQSLPAGTVIDYLTDRGRVRDVVQDAGATPSSMMSQCMAIAIAATFALFGLGLALAASDFRSALAAAALAGIATLFAPLFLEATASAIHHESQRLFMLGVWQSFPRPLALFWMPLFAASFPRPLPRRGEALRILLVLTFISAASLALLESVNQIPALTDGVSLTQQRLLLIVSAIAQRAAYASSLITMLVAIYAQSRARRSLSASEAARRGIVWSAVLFGFGVPVTAGIAQIVSRMVLHRWIVPSSVMLSLFGAMLIIPPAIVYAARARRVDSVRLLVRRAILFTFTLRGVQIASVFPAVVVAGIIYRHRNQPIAMILGAHPIAFTAAVVIAVASVLLAGAIHTRVEALFFRGRIDARATLAALVERVRETQTIDELASLLEGDIERALHLESIAVFIRDRTRGRFLARGVPWFLESFSMVAEALERVGDVLDVDLADARSPFANVSELERLWLETATVRLLVPLRVGGGVIGFIALGEKRSQLPFDRNDRLMLKMIAASAGLIAENQLLRSSSPRSAIEDRDDEDADAVDPSASYCLQCRRISAVGAAVCEYDGGSLKDAEIPALVCGKYQLESYLGSGGMGVVFRARDLALGRTVAIKTLPQLSASATERFRREARLGATLTHPSLAVVFAAETWRGRPLLVMEYLAYGTLASRLSNPLPADELIEYAIRIAEALAALHDAGVLHRDVKPSNIGFASAREPKLLDFGLARITADSSVVVSSDVLLELRQSSETSGIIGTPAYLPPEALVGKGNAASVDLWGLAMSLYEAATGTHPFLEANPVRLMNRIVSEDVPDLRRIRPDLPEPFIGVLSASLARNPSSRLSDARSLARAFRDAAVS